MHSSSSLEHTPTLPLLFRRVSPYISPQFPTTSWLCWTCRKPTAMQSHFFAVTHEPFELHSGNIPRFGLLNRQDCRCAIACVLKTQQFFFNDFDIIGSLSTGVDWNQLPCHVLAVRTRAGNQTGEQFGLSGRKNAVGKQSLLERYQDIQESGHPVDNKMSKTGGLCVRRLLFGSENWSWTRQTMEKLKDEKLITRQEQALWPEWFGWRWKCLFFMKKCGKYVARRGWAGDWFSEESVSVEEYKMVVCPTHENDERRSRKPH